MTIAIIVVVMLIGLIGIALTRPRSIVIQRVSDVKAPPERIFAFINDFHEWPKWAPQDKSDSTMMRSFDGPASGTGASSDWVSRGRAGTGRMEITESTAPVHITVKVEFVKPFRACNINSFALVPGFDKPSREAGCPETGCE